MKWPRWLGSRIKILKNTLHSKLSEKTGLPKRKVYLTGFHLWDYAMLLSKPATISCRFGCAACAWYTFIKLGIMMCIFSFVYFLSQCLFFLACCSNWMILRSIGKKKLDKIKGWVRATQMTISLKTEYNEETSETTWRDLLSLYFRHKPFTTGMNTQWGNNNNDYWDSCWRFEEVQIWVITT